MGKRFINGSDLLHMAVSASEFLHARSEQVNALNVFPVPDGDTGTNMNLTLTSGVEELRKKPSAHIGKASEVFAKGLLMGARGNSGVILSQLFRGFAKSASALEEMNAAQFATALQQGVDTAYQAVVKPVEGTILTVSKEAAREAVLLARRTDDISELMKGVLVHAKEALAQTPELLPVLKQVGVVDAGGQGLVIIYEGFIQILSGEWMDEGSMNPAKLAVVEDEEPSGSPIRVVNLAEEAHRMEGQRSAQSHLATEDIEFGYCTEFLVNLKPDKVPGVVFDESSFRKELAEAGDSLLVVADDNLVKVHIHAEYPGTVMNLAMNYGDLSRIKIENMRDQHTHILEQDAMPAASADLPGRSEDVQEERGIKEYGMIAVAMGEGISEILESIGVDYVLAGGQTMNPSTEDLMNAISEVKAEKIFIFPNNSNIILAAEQAKELADKEVAVIPSKSIPQGMAAILAFHEKAGLAQNVEEMNRAMSKTRSGQITFAVRDSKIDGLQIKEGDFLGIADGKIVISSPELIQTAKQLLQSIIAEGDEIVTVFSGEDASEEETGELVKFLNETYPDAEIELHYGGQPLYYYLVSVE